ncbi:hypothetical protein ACLMJK_001382 [Lecanora helva]
MSFGFSIPDVFALGKLAWDTIQKSRSACGEHDELTREVSALHVALKRMQQELDKPESPINKPGETCRGELQVTVADCGQVLQVLDKILTKYNALSEQERSGRKLWQKVRFSNGEMGDLANLRGKLVLYTSTMSFYLNMVSVGTVGRVEQQMHNAGGVLKDLQLAVNSIAAQFSAKSAHEGSISVFTNYADDDKGFWRELRRELVHDGFSSSTIRHHKHTIVKYIQELGNRGLLDDPEPLDAVPEAASEIDISASSCNKIDELGVLSDTCTRTVSNNYKDKPGINQATFDDIVHTSDNELSGVSAPNSPLETKIAAKNANHAYAETAADFDLERQSSPESEPRSPVLNAGSTHGEEELRNGNSPTVRKGPSASGVELAYAMSYQSDSDSAEVSDSFSGSHKASGQCKTLPRSSTFQEDNRSSRPASTRVDSTRPTPKSHQAWDEVEISSQNENSDAFSGAKEHNKIMLDHRAVAGILKTDATYVIDSLGIVYFTKEGPILNAIEERYNRSSAKYDQRKGLPWDTNCSNSAQEKYYINLWRLSYSIEHAILKDLDCLEDRSNHDVKTAKRNLTTQAESLLRKLHDKLDIVSLIPLHEAWHAYHDGLARRVIFCKTNSRSTHNEDLQVILSQIMSLLHDVRRLGKSRGGEVIPLKDHLIKQLLAMMNVLHERFTQWNWLDARYDPVEGTTLIEMYWDQMEVVCKSGPPCQYCNICPRIEPILEFNANLVTSRSRSSSMDVERNVAPMETVAGVNEVSQTMASIDFSGAPDQNSDWSQGSQPEKASMDVNNTLDQNGGWGHRSRAKSSLGPTQALSGFVKEHIVQRSNGCEQTFLNL